MATSGPSEHPGLFAELEPNEAVKAVLGFQGDKITTFMNWLTEEQGLSREDALPIARRVASITGSMVDYVAEGVGYEGDYSDEELGWLSPNEESQGGQG